MEYLNVFEPKILKNHLTLNRVVDGDGVILNDLGNKSEYEIRVRNQIFGDRCPGS